MSGEIIPLQINVSGFSDKPITAFFLIYKDLKTVVASKVSPSFLEKRKSQELVFITNDSMATDFDLKINDTQFGEVVDSYMRVKSRVLIDDNNQSFKPRIQIDKYEESGAKLEIGSNLNNNHMATIFAAYYLECFVDRSRALEQLIDFNDYEKIDRDNARFDIITI
jgi:hypothetical protein